MYMRKVLISLGSNEMVIDMVLITKYSSNDTISHIEYANTQQGRGKPTSQLWTCRNVSSLVNI